MRKNPAYSKADLKRWQTDMTLRQPSRPSGGLMSAATIVSMGIGETDTGILMVIRNAHNETQTLFLNPVVAAAMRDAILTAGIKGNWLTEKGEVIAPTLPT